LARLLSEEPGNRVLLISTDPARTLGTLLDRQLDHEPRPVEAFHAMQLDPAAERTVFLDKWRETLVTLVDRGTYLDREEALDLVNATLPGGDESFGLLRLAAIAREDSWTHVVVDTAPTGHTLRLLAMPETMRALVRLLDAFQERHRALVKALTRRYRTDEVDRFLDEMREGIEALDRMLHDANRTTAVVITRAENVVAAETGRLVSELRSMRVHLSAIVVIGNKPGDDITSLEVLRQSGKGAIWLEVPWHSPPAGRSTKSHAAGAPESLVGRATPLTIVCGKGGVGKTTVSCALAIALADAGFRTLLVSTDPAPSVADALDISVGDEETPIEANLAARQFDGEASFRKFRDEYGDRVAHAVASIAPGTSGGALDELMSLAPPGIDELYALASLGDAITNGRYERVVVDPAPTGHLIRLLELPPVALEWTHQLMRLMLKYRDVAPLGDAAEGLLDFARHSRPRHHRWRRDLESRAKSTASTGQHSARGAISVAGDGAPAARS
jgi:arsenite/tail-anchored protein-transporting ATPase